MSVTLELYELKNLLMEMSELGVAHYVKRVAPAKDIISQRQAFLEFGETRVRHWVQKGLVSHSRLGPGKNSKLGYSRAELMTTNESEKLKAIIDRQQYNLIHKKVIHNETNQTTEPIPVQLQGDNKLGTNLPG